MSPGNILLGHYEEEYMAVAHSIREKLKGSEKDIHNDIQAAENVLKKMEIEALSEELQHSRRAALAKVESFRADLELIKKELSKNLSSSDTHVISFERDVVDDQFNHESREINSANARLLSDYEHIQRTNTRLDRTQRLAAEAEQIGANVLSDLRRQREQIERASQTLHETDIDIDRSNRMLRKMVRKVYANRIISIIILISLTACVMLVIWVKFIPN